MSYCDTLNFELLTLNSQLSTMPSQLDYKLTLQTFQSQRLRRDHADLADEPQYRRIAEFFFQEMYGPNDFSAARVVASLIDDAGLNFASID